MNALRTLIKHLKFITKKCIWSIGLLVKSTPHPTPSATVILLDTLYVPCQTGKLDLLSKTSYLQLLSEAKRTEVIKTHSVGTENACTDNDAQKVSCRIFRYQWTFFTPSTILNTGPLKEA